MPFYTTLSLMIATIISLVFGIIGYYIGSLFGYSLTGIFCSAVFAFGSYLAYAVYIAREKEATNLQIFGKKSRCLNKDGQHAGLKLVARPFEKIFKVVTVQQDFPIELYRDAGERAEVDFTDCSSIINATAWIRVFDPEKFAYEVTNPERYAENFVDSATRPHFATRTLDKANADKSDIASEALPKINDDDPDKHLVGLKEKAGAEMTRLFIEDFAFPAEVKAIRQQYLQGETDAKRLKAKFDGVIDSIANISKGLINEGMTQEKAVEKATMIFFEQTGMETAKDTKANITFITENVRGMLRVFAPTGSQQGGAK